MKSDNKEESWEEEDLDKKDYVQLEKPKAIIDTTFATVDTAAAACIFIQLILTLRLFYFDLLILSFCKLTRLISVLHLFSVKSDKPF